jgi:hypothetical protein
MMKKDYFVFEFIKSGPFMLLLIVVLLIILGIVISNHHKDSVKMKEDVIYVAPKPKNQ